MAKISEYSHSEIGTSHWFNTLMGTILHIGEYMQENGIGRVSEDGIKEWGKVINGRSQELLEWYRTSTIPVKENLINELEQALTKLKSQ